MVSMDTMRVPIFIENHLTISELKDIQKIFSFVIQIMASSLLRVIATGTMVSSMSVVSFRTSGLHQRTVLITRTMRI